jgi:hypothetical protein
VVVVVSEVVVVVSVVVVVVSVVVPVVVSGPVEDEVEEVEEVDEVDEVDSVSESVASVAELITSSPLQPATIIPNASAPIAVYRIAIYLGSVRGL